MGKKIVVLPPAERALKRLAKTSLPVLVRIDHAVNQLSVDPMEGKPLHGDLSGKRSLRIGDWRIIYEFDSPSQTVFVYDIAHRRDVYR